ncbi:hypothetical protein [Streptomyces sp. NBC_00203]|uniref:hypothetical protein n=1 Tax=Streptomyces sp. NBC_00203 TaxID=2975680 RepID=UPI00324FF1EE
MNEAVRERQPARRLRAPRVLHPQSSFRPLLSCVEVNRTLAAPRRDIGDFDCSGAGIGRDWVKRTGCWDQAERVLLTYEQTIAYGLLAAEGKKDDPRWPGVARTYGCDINRPVQWEVEALEQPELQRLVLDAIDPYVDRDVLAMVPAEEQPQRRELANFLARYQGG